MFTDTKLLNFNFLDARIKDIYLIRSLLAFDRDEFTPLNQTLLPLNYIACKSSDIFAPVANLPQTSVIDIPRGCRH